MKLEEFISGFEEFHEEKDKAYLKICVVQSLLDSVKHRIEIVLEKKQSSANLMCMGIDGCREEFSEADREYSFALHIKGLLESKLEKLENEFYKTHIRKAT